jgi:hypothetical protein
MSHEKLGEKGYVVTTGTPKLPFNAGQTGNVSTNGPRIPPKGGSGTAPPTSRKK